MRRGGFRIFHRFDVFKEELLPAINAIHGKVEHVGKVGTNNDELGLHRRTMHCSRRWSSSLIITDTFSSRLMSAAEYFLVFELGLHRRLKALQEQLEAALREKRYVDAGRLNKRIYEINKTLFGAYVVPHTGQTFLGAFEPKSQAHTSSLILE